MRLTRICISTPPSLGRTFYGCQRIRAAGFEPAISNSPSSRICQAFPRPDRGSGTRKRPSGFRHRALRFRRAIVRTGRVSTASGLARAGTRRAIGGTRRLANDPVKPLTESVHRSPVPVSDLRPVGSRYVGLGHAGRHRRVWYLTDARAARDVRAKSANSREGRTTGGRGTGVQRQSQPSGNRWRASQTSITQLDAGPVSLECGKGLERPADGAPEPEAARPGDDHRISPGDANLEVADTIAEGLADLALDSPLRDELGIGLGLGVTAGRTSGRGSRWFAQGGGGGNPKRRPSTPGARRGADGSFSSTGLSVIPVPRVRRGTGRRAGDPVGLLSGDGSSMSGSIVSGILSCGDGPGTASIGGIPFDGERGRVIGAVDRAGGASIRSEKGEIPVCGGLTDWGLTVARGRAVGAVTPGIASIGPGAGRGCAACAALG